MSDSGFIRLDMIQQAPTTESLEAVYSPQMQTALGKAFEMRKTHFVDEITFHAPGLRRYKTSEYTHHNGLKFVSLSLTGSDCALACDHCNMKILDNMISLPASGKSLFALCSALHEQGAQGVLVSGGSDKKGRVPLLRHIPDLIRVRRELDMTIRVHVGIPDEETVAALAEVDIDGAMLDIIGDEDTLRDVYHLEKTTVDDFDRALDLLDQYGVPSIPHIILGLHYGQMRGEHTALEIIARHNPRVLILVILMPLSGTAMVGVKPPSSDEIIEFFAHSRNTLPQLPIMLGCARPIGNIKLITDRAAIDAGFNGIAYPAEGVIQYARQRGLQPKLVDACCGVQW